MISPVAGLVTSVHSAVLDSTQRPSTKFGTLMIGGAATAIDEPPSLWRHSKLSLYPCFFMATRTRVLQVHLYGLHGFCLLAHPLESRLQHIERFVHLFVADYQRNQNTDHVGVRACGDRNQSVLVAILRHFFSLICRRFATLRRLNQF